MRKKQAVVMFMSFSILLLLILTACTVPITVETSTRVVDPTEVVEMAPQEPTQPALQFTNRAVRIADVQVEIGIGSPIPVEAIAAGSWPDLCDQVEQINQSVAEFRFDIEILASGEDANCPPDLVGLPFRMAIPLNMVSMPAGTYTVVVNGMETTFDWPAATPEAMPIENLGLTFAFIGTDGNLWISEPAGGPARQLTSDAVPIEAGGDTVSYYFPKISSDGRYIAVRRDAGVPVSDGYQFTFGLLIFDNETGETSAVFTDSEFPPAGFDWKPASHLLAYGVGADPEYFQIRENKPDPEKASGIYTVDLDSGQSGLLVNPENGYALIQPVWSPDGRFLSFDELAYMEGRGPFAYFNLETQEYTSWGEPLGNYDWFPDSSMLLYDRMIYVASGTERIFSQARVGGVEMQVSLEPGQGYAFYPVYSPDGFRFAYLVNPGSPDDLMYTLVVQDLEGNLSELGSFENAWDLEWSSDGKVLFFSAGPHEGRQVMAIDLIYGTATVLVDGSQPTLARP